MFGKRKGPATPPLPPMDSDGKRRVLGEAAFAGKHGDMLRALGLSLDDPSNVLPDANSVDLLVKASLARQEARRSELEAKLLQEHGHNALRPFFILSEPVFKGVLGSWLMLAMKLLPYDDWNVVYLPMDSATQLAMGNLPLHPRQSVGPIDKLMVERIGGFHTNYLALKRQVDARVAAEGFDAAAPLVERFVEWTDALPAKILDYVGTVRPMVIALIADVQGKSAAGR